MILGIFTMMAWMEISMSDGKNVNYQPEVITQEGTAWYGEIGAKIDVLQYGYISSSIKSRMYYSDDFSSPTYIVDTVSYSIEAGITFDCAIFGIRHICAHPVVPSLYVLRGKVLYDSNLTEVFLRFELKEGNK